MPEHVVSDREFSSNLVQDKFLKPGAAGAGTPDAAKKLADKMKPDAAIDSVAKA